MYGDAAWESGPCRSPLACTSIGVRRLDPQRLDGDLRKLLVVAGGQAVSGSGAALRSLQLPARHLGDLFEFSNKA